MQLRGMNGAIALVQIFLQFAHQDGGRHTYMKVCLAFHPGKRLFSRVLWLPMTAINYYASASPFALRWVSSRSGFQLERY